MVILVWAEAGAILGSGVQRRDHTLLLWRRGPAAPAVEFETWSQPDACEVYATTGLYRISTIWSTSNAGVPLSSGAYMPHYRGWRGDL